VHAASARRHHPFVVVDCGAIARTLIEAELFGHERGAYTGATQDREGAFVTAGGGTIFLDEVGELDLEMQPRLLRVLERREVKPLGGSAARRVDVRIIAATNRNLLDEVARGSFRVDLYYRLAVTCVRLPPLRQRPEDVPLLCQDFLAEFSARDHAEHSLPPDVVEQLANGRWPGNVRELRNNIEQMVTFGSDAVRAPPAGTPDGRPPGERTRPFHQSKAEVVARFERDYLVDVLRQHGRNFTAAAAAAGVDRVHFLRLLDRYGLRGRGRA
jgi:transcriptional regulator with PAS, ATPase and Fis domain